MPYCVSQRLTALKWASTLSANEDNFALAAA